MATNTQQTLLQINGDATGGTNALNQTEKGVSAIMNSLSGLSNAFNSTSSAAGIYEDANGRLRDASGKFVSATNAASKSTEGAFGSMGGLIAAFLKLNPATVLAALGLGGFVTELVKGIGKIKEFAGEVIAVVGPAQNLVINLEALAARELVNAGDFENASEAMDVAAVAAQGFLKDLQLLGLESPFENRVVVQTFKQGLAYGFVSDQAFELTRATLNMASGLGMASGEMSMVGLVMGQIRSTGKLLTQDLRQLKSRGIDLSAILRDDLGVSVDEFNAGLQSGKFSMDDLLDSFVKYSDTNFGGASKRLAGTVQGLASSFQDLKEIALTTTFKPMLDTLTQAAAKVFDFVSEFVTASGIFEIAGKIFNSVAKVLVGAFEFIFGGVRKLFDLFATMNLTLDGADYWLKEISKSLRLIWGEIFQMIYPALEQVRAIMRSLSSFDLSAVGVQFQDTVNVILKAINGMLETIRRLLQGEGLSSFDPLRSSFVDVLTLMALAWDRFAADAIRWGWGFVTNLAAGIWEAAKSTLSTVMTAVGNLIGLFLKPGSPPKKGPLSHIVEWARGVMNVFLEGFKTADFAILRDSLAPIKAALQDAVSAGNLDEIGFLETFKTIREQVAGLIAEFRKTGEISEEALGGIAERLGEGSEELVKYLRLQLKFSKSQDDLAKIQEEVAEAEAAGFVPQELAQKLQSAQDAAQAAQDELAWQKELLAVQQDSVDLQLQMVTAMKKLTDALKAAAGASEKVGAGTGGAGEVTPIGPIESPLSGLIDGFGGAGDATEAISGISEEFEIMREKVEAFINLPIADHLENMGRALADALGLDYDKMVEFFEDLGNLDTDKIAGYISDFVGSIFDELDKEVPLITARLRGLMDRIFDGITRIVAENGPRWGEDIGKVIGVIAGVLLTKLTVDLPQFLRKIGNIIGVLIVLLVSWLVTEGPGFAAKLFLSFLSIVDKWFEKVSEFKAAFIAIMTGYLKGYFEGLLATAPEWLVDMVNTGELIITSITEGIENASSNLEEAFDTAFGAMGEKLTEFWEEAQPTLDEFKEKLETIHDFVDQNFRPLFEGLAEFMSEVFKTAIWGVTQGLGRLRDMVVGKVSKAFENIKNKLEQDIIPAFERIRDFIRDEVIPRFDDLAANIRDGIGEKLQWLNDNVLAPVSQGFRDISDGVNNIIDKLPLFGQKFEEMDSKLEPFRNSLDLVKGVFELLGKAIETTVGWLEAAIDAMRRWRDEKDNDTKPNPDQNPQSLIPAGQLRGGLTNALALSLAGIQGNLAGAGAGGQQINMYFGSDSLSFPNVRDGRDAEGVVRELNRIALQGTLASKVKG